MKWQTLAAAALAVSVISPASAQIGPYRRFTQDDPSDINRNNRIGYVPVLRTFTGRRTGDGSYLLPSASWFQEASGSHDRKPDMVRDNARYTLEAFEPIQGDAAGRMRVVITRSPAPPADSQPPLLQLVETRSRVTTRATPEVEAMADGVRYTFTVSPFQVGVVSERSKPQRYQVDFVPEKGVSRPDYIAMWPTFGGATWWERATQGPPRLPYAERVAGKRIEYRSASDAGRVIDSKVAGKRQEFRLRAEDRDSK